MFYVIGLGLYDEKDISVRGLEVRTPTILNNDCLILQACKFQVVKASSRVYLEAYTSILMTSKENLVRDLRLWASCHL